MSELSESGSGGPHEERFVDMTPELGNVEDSVGAQGQDAVATHVSQTQMDSQMLEYNELPSEAHHVVEEGNSGRGSRSNLISRNKRDDTIQAQGYTWTRPQPRPIDYGGPAFRNRGITLSGESVLRIWIEWNESLT